MATIDLSSMPVLKYEPLDDATKHIRVLEIWPGNDNEIIQCTLRQADLLTGYVCLSYMWGNERDMSTILVNGQKIRIRSNLHHFLQQARRCRTENEKYQLPWWIDAICIDQEGDMEEKRAQVTMMGDIYSSAMEVIVWLGTGDSKRYNMLEVMATFSILYEAKADEAWGDSGPVPISPSLISEVSSIIQDMGLTRDDFDDNEAARYCWSIYQHFTHLTYWSRLWTVQEIVLARKLCFWYGQLQLPEILLQIVMEIMEKLYSGQKRFKESHFDLSAELRFYDVYRMSQTQQPIFELLRRLHKHECTDARDKVYGIRAITRNGLLIPVDYSIAPRMLLPTIFKDFHTQHPVLNGAWAVRSLGLSENDLASLDDDFNEVLFEDYPMDIGILKRDGVDDHAWLIDATPSRRIIIHPSAAEASDINHGDTIVQLYDLAIFLVFGQDEDKLASIPGEAIITGHRSSQKGPLKNILQIDPASRYIAKPWYRTIPPERSSKSSMILQPVHARVYEFFRERIRFHSPDSRPSSSFSLKPNLYDIEGVGIDDDRNSLAEFMPDQDNAYMTLDWKCLLKLWKLLLKSPFLLLMNGRDLLDDNEWH